MSAPVVIDARAAARAEIGGVERWTRELAARLPAMRPDRYSVARPPAALAHRAGHAWEQFVLPLAARRAELILCPANLAPLASRRNVVLIHDAAPIRHPEWYRPFYARYQRALLPRLARRARRLVAPSEFSRDELASLGVPEQRISVLAPGVDERFTPDADPVPARAAHALERPYVLAVATRIARKNLPALAGAAERLAGEGVELVTAGSGRGYMRGDERPPGRALGYVREEHLPGLYAGALALAMPSLYEGFGLPCLEAMASGVPVVASDRAALPETCAGAALLVDPNDARALTAALLAAAFDADERARLIEAGRLRASEFGWDRTAAGFDRVIEEELAQP